MIERKEKKQAIQSSGLQYKQLKSQVSPRKKLGPIYYLMGLNPYRPIQILQTSVVNFFKKIRPLVTV